MSAAVAAGSVRVAAPAKINLFLHVVGRRPDGYHLLDSLIAFASVHDTLVAAPADRLTLTLDGPYAASLGDAGEDNLVLRAAHALGAAAGRRAAAALTLTKRLPIASGIGGGSADAAATLKALATLWRLDIAPEELARIALGLGADVPMCLSGRAARVGGIGERIVPIERLPEAGLVLANPNLPLATASVFKARRGAFSEAATFQGAPKDAASLATALRATHNDLEAPARALLPAIDQVLGALRAIEGCLLARMSGSGATCFGLFESEAMARRAGADLSRHYPGWWVAPGHLLATADELAPV